MEPKKISFGFSKITRKPNLIPVKGDKQENQVELIKCLEGHEIKLIEEHKEIAPIVIPMKENGKTSAALASLMKRRAVLLGEDDETNSTKSDQAKEISKNENSSIENDLDKQAALEILAELKKNDETVEDSGLVLPVLKPDELPLDGAKESTMDDYESIPIEQYGLAMLRGMGWIEPPPTKKSKLADDGPTVRPKGMGLGADKALKPKPLLIQPETNEVLEIKKQSYVRILGGKYKDAYGQIEGFDDDAGRVIVKLAIGGTKEAFNEFLCQPVSKKEFTQYGKCINTKKYEEYKKFENEHGQIIVKKEEPSKLKTEFKAEKVKKEESSKLKTEFKVEKDEKKIIKSENNSKPKSVPSSSNYESNGVPSRRYDEYATVSSKSRGRSRSRSGSTSRSRIPHSSRRNDNECDDLNDSCTNESDNDSAYDRRHKHKKKSKSKSKSHSRKSKSSKKKSKKLGSDSESDDDTERDREHSSSKKNKKKTKKSKKQRSRTPSRHRR